MVEQDYWFGQETMDIYSQKGAKVRFAFPDNGWRGDQEDAAKYLELGKVYTVEYTSVGGSRTDVQLQEVPEKMFNSVHFVSEGSGE